MAKRNQGPRIDMWGNLEGCVMGWADDDQSVKQAFEKLKTSTKTNKMTEDHLDGILGLISSLLHARADKIKKAADAGL